MLTLNSLVGKMVTIVWCDRTASQTALAYADHEYAAMFVSGSESELVTFDTDQVAGIVALTGEDSAAVIVLK